MTLRTHSSPAVRTASHSTLYAALNFFFFSPTIMYLCHTEEVYFGLVHGHLLPKGDPRSMILTVLKPFTMKIKRHISDATQTKPIYPHSTLLAPIFHLSCINSLQKSALPISQKISHFYLHLIAIL